MIQADKFDELRQLLDSTYKFYNKLDFIQTDPIQVPHSFERKEDIEISAFLTCTIAWGQRKTIISNAFRLMKLMDNSPFDFLKNSSGKEWDRFGGFVHRTFQTSDLLYFLDALKRVYNDHGGLEKVFSDGLQNGGVFEALIYFRKVFMQWDPLPRLNKHVSNPDKGSAAKRLNLFLMWMVRKDNIGVHFGLWNEFSPKDLIIPLDVHVGRVSRNLGLLARNSNDWRAAEELTVVLRAFDPEDPVKYDFSLFGMGQDQKF